MKFIRHDRQYKQKKPCKTM